MLVCILHFLPLFNANGGSMFRVWLFTGVFLTGMIQGASCLAQVHGPRVYEIPRIFYRPQDNIDVNQEIDFDNPGEVYSQRIWIVRSDRQNNPTYENPSENGSVKRRLEYLDWFYVIGHDREWIQLARPRDSYELDGLYLPTNYIDYGWVKKENMLLWTIAVETTDRVYRKAMLLNNIDALLEFATRMERTDLILHNERINFVNSPAFDAGVTGNQARLFEYFYIFKESGDWVLLGRQHNFPSQAGDELVTYPIYGWVHKTLITPWDHRIALEPNWEEAARRERSDSRHLITRVFLDEVQAINYYTNRNFERDDVVWSADPLEGRPIADWPRFPRLDYYELDNNIARVGVIGELGPLDRSDNSGGIGSQFIAEYQQRISNNINNIREIRVIFVIDATKSIEPYIIPIRNALQRSIQSISNSERGNQYRFGAVVYRDTTLSNRNDWVDPFPIGSPASLERWIQDIEPINTSDHYESMYYGLHSAAYSCGLNDSNTNVVILIGDAGDRNNGNVDLQGMIDQFSDFETNFAVFQIGNRSNSAYTDFIDQSKNLIMNSFIQNRERAIESASGTNDINTNDVPDWQERELANGRCIEFLLDPTTNWFYSLNAGETLQANTLSDLIVEFINTIDITNQRGRYYYESRLAGQDTDTDSAFYEASITIDGEEYTIPTQQFDQALWLLLNENRDLHEGWIRILEEEGAQLFIQGYTPIRVQNRRYPLYKHVLLFSDDELTILVDKLSNIATMEPLTIENMEDFCKTLYEIFQQLLTGYTSQPRSTWNDLNLEEVQRFALGIESESDFLNTTSLGDLWDGEVDYNELKNWERSMINSYDELNRIQSLVDFDLYFQRGGNTYFWIDEEYLP